MQISRAQHDEWIETIQDLTAKESEARNAARDLQRQVNNFDEILDKVVRAARGLPIIQNRNVDPMAMIGSNYRGDNVGGHQCTIPGELEVLRWELSAARMTIVALETQLAGTVAIAEFAKEHKA